MNNPLVSIYVPTFNHENYITQALDSILMQQTEYSYEVLIGEDCSTDNTRQVVKDWQAAHPDERFVFFYRQNNMHKAEISNALDLKLRCKGKYLICLEGDDFWTDPMKLQKQVSFLETHPDYYAVAHNCTVVGEDSQPNGETYPQCKDEEYTFQHYGNNILPGQFTTLLARNYMTDPEMDQTLLHQRLGPGDRHVYFSLLFHGRIHCMQQTMSAYRHITSGGSSFSATRRYNYDTQEAADRSQLLHAYKMNNGKAAFYLEHLYLLTIRQGLLHRHIGIGRAWADLKNVRHKARALAMLPVRDFRCKILRQKLAI